MEQYDETLCRQLCLDYDCSEQDLLAPGAVIRPYCRKAGMRPVGEGSLLKGAVYRGKLLVMADERLLLWCRETLMDVSPAWLSEPESLRVLDDQLRALGQRLTDTHHHYLPAEGFPETPKRFDTRWYERDELTCFQGDGRFWEALLFDERTPDMLAVCAMEEDVILGMASVTRNCERLWEIGVNVTSEGRGRGVGAFVVGLLKDEVLRRGIVPTYATVESHIQSQRVAFRAGFLPAFYELFSS